MSTLENTISMLEVLPEADLIEIQKITKKFFKRHECEMADHVVGEFLKPMSEKDFLKDIEVAEKQFAAGEYQEMKEAIDEICREYGI